MGDSNSLPATGASNNASQERKYYNTRTWFSAILGIATPEEVKGYLQERDIIEEKSDLERCEQQKQWLFQNSPMIRFLREQIQLLGGDINPTNVRCGRCTTAQTGGMHQDYGILLCANAHRKRSVLEDTLAHEMVHCWDHLKYNIDDNNLRHAACTEIRAATLSGECRLYNEVWRRGQWGLTQKLQDCVRRRAALSVKNRPNCKDDVQAARVVNEVWDSCFTDTRPFDEIYR
ncbi:MAG: Mitochondrial inner membrane protease atp23 [Bathelium mastoideum]|nr:MAG: Mitochondrial inner membrane protease atp23 [Bathelium mastoideum]